MKRSYLIPILPLALATAYPSAASADSFSAKSSTEEAAMKWEMAYLALSAVDAAQTIDGLNSGSREGNPLIGKNPSAAKVIAFKLGLGALHFGLFKAALDRSPTTAMRVAQISAGLQGGVVMLNARVTFR